MPDPLSGEPPQRLGDLGGLAAQGLNRLQCGAAREPPRTVGQADQHSDGPLHLVRITTYLTARRINFITERRHTVGAVVRV